MELLNTSAIEAYIKSLDLANNKDKALIFAGLNTLNNDLYVTVISALAGGALTYEDIKALPTISDFTINLLLKGKLSLTNIGYIQYNYQVNVIPKLPTYSALKAQYIGSYKQYVAKTVIDLDPWFVDVLYIYDNGSIGFLNFDDAQTFYYQVMAKPEISTAINKVKTYFDTNKVGLEGLENAVFEENYFAKALLSTKTELVFFPVASKNEFNTGYATTVSWLMKKLFTNIRPSNFDTGLKDIALIAANNNAEDKTLYGGNGRIAIDKMTLDWTQHKTLSEDILDSLIFKGLFTYELYGEDSSSATSYYNFYYELVHQCSEALINISTILNNEFNASYEV